MQITQQNDIPHYTAAEIAAAFRPLKPNGHDHTPPEPPASLSPAEEARLRCALEVIPADERKIWLTVGMALHAVGARTIWDDWSKTCPEAFDQADQDKTWAGFKDDRENGITIATVYHMACKAGWHEPSRAKPDDGYVPPGEASVPPAPPNRDNLVISAWLTKEIPPRDHLLGVIMCTTSRLLVLGETGIGKTLVGMAVGGAISAGMNFLRWAGQRRSRVMYLDGDLPIETFKERMELVAALYGQDIEFYGYNRDDLGDGQMPPLNIEEGQKWLRREIEAINPDLIFFDSIMSLLMGTMSEEESWTPMKRLVRELTSRRIAQAWLHHTNDLGKGFGTKTREWEMDTVAALSRHVDDEGTPDDGAIKFEFRKTRLCTPANVEQFKPLIIHPGDEWRFEDAQKGGAKRQSDASILAREILKAYDRLSDGVVKCPGLDGQPVRMVKTQAIRDELKSRGFLDHNDGTITPASRTMLCKAKTMLLKDVRLVENEGLVWRP